MFIFITYPGKGLNPSWKMYASHAKNIFHVCAGYVPTKSCTVVKDVVVSTLIKYH